MAKRVRRGVEIRDGACDTAVSVLFSLGNDRLTSRSNLGMPNPYCVFLEGLRPLINREDLDQGDAGRSILPAQDRGVRCRRQGRDNG